MEYLRWRPENLISDTIRSKIYQHPHWKEECSRLTVEMLKNKVMELDHFGGTYSDYGQPTPFLCLLLKMLHFQPSMHIVHSFIFDKEYKYVRLLGAFYLRLMGIDDDVYRFLEPLYKNYQELRQKSPDEQITFMRVNEVIDDLLKKNYFCDITLPRIMKRSSNMGAMELKGCTHRGAMKLKGCTNAAKRVT